MRRKNQWKITNIRTGEVSYFSVGSPKRSKLHFKTIIQGGLTVLISVLVIFTIVKAGSLTPSSNPAPEGYTLADIYTRLTTNATTTSGNFSMDPSGSASSTLYTLEQIYNAIPTIVANTVKLSTTYLGVDGTLVPSGGDAETTDVCQNKTFFGANQTDWNLKIGSLTITPSTVMSGTTICGVAGTAIANPTYGDNDASKVLTTAANAGTYNATNLIPENVRNTIAFGVNQTGTFTGNLAYGDDDPSKVLTTAATPGTWRAYNLNDSVVKFGIEYAISSTGALLPSGGTATSGDVVSGKTFFGASQTDWNLQTGTFAPQEKTATLQNQEVTPDSGNWLSKVIVNITNLIASVIKKGETVGGITGTYSGYPGTGWVANPSGSGSTPLNKANCESAHSENSYYWKWFEDANGDGDQTDPEDGMCVLMCTGSGCTAANTASWTNNYTNDAYLSISWNGAEQVVPNTLSATTITGGSSNSVTGSWAGGANNAYKNHLARVQTGTGASIDCWGRVQSSNTTTITVYGSWLTSAYAACATTPGAGNTVRIIDDDKYDNSWIGDWTCTGNFPTGTPVWNSYPTSAQVGSNLIALATADCLDGKRDLLPIVDESSSDSRIVISGTAEAGTATTLTDNDASWDANVWIGQKVKIFAGTSAGSEGIIKSNTATVLTVESWSAGNPGSDSQYGIIYIVPHASHRPNISSVTTENNGPLKAEVFNNWKGTRLPSHSDFFGVCGSASQTTNKSFGNYGGQLGRSDEYLNKANSGVWEWLSEQRDYYSARTAGVVACSYFADVPVDNGSRFRSVFRP